MKARVLFSTVGDAEAAEQLARAWVEARLAACVQVLPKIESTYRWKGAIERSSESLLVAKFACRDDEVAGCLRGFAEAHPYEVPELVVLDAVAVGDSYLDWLLREGRSPGDR